MCWAENGGTHKGRNNNGVGWGGVGWQDGNGDGEAVTSSNGLRNN